jgi:hypothetical protein
MKIQDIKNPELQALVILLKITDEELAGFDEAELIQSVVALNTISKGKA